MALGKISVVFILLASALSFDVKAETKQDRADAGCAKWCENQKDVDEYRYIGGKCAGDRVFDIYGRDSRVGCETCGCCCKKKDKKSYDCGLNKSVVVDEKGSEISSSTTCG